MYTCISHGIVLEFNGFMQTVDPDTIKYVIFGRMWVLSYQSMVTKEVLISEKATSNQPVVRDFL